MAKVSQCGCLIGGGGGSTSLLPFTSSQYPFKVQPQSATYSRRVVFTTCASKFDIFNLVGKSCQTCKSQGAIECPGCKGTGKNKKNGNMFERWKCYDCQGFGLKSCPNCGKGGLTPEQRGER